MDSEKYKKCASEQEEKFESICLRCGECCGALDDVCVNLVKTKTGNRWFCKEYNDRFKLQKTVSGKSFRCVSIREHILNDTLRPNCAYRAS
ncbi:MAG: hypothetical protein ISS33_01285 [Candidatus Omnitrophica bacterium]|nr:hypothetical protein [Candidatus Omnitrophota bacterium]